MRILGVFLLAGLFAGAILISPGASRGQFLDYPFLILVVGGTLAVLLVSHGGTPWRHCPDFDDCRIWRSGSRIRVASGGVEQSHRPEVVGKYT